MDTTPAPHGSSAASHASGMPDLAAFALAFRAADSAPSLAEAAHTYAAVGVPVFPCVSGAKQPLTNRGFHDASSDQRLVEAWWRWTPDANVGIPTGAASGLDVVDVDQHSESGFPAFNGATRRGLTAGWAWTVRTPSGGMHFYFPHPVGVEQRSWTTRARIDFRGDGGYVVAPPSRVRLGDGELRYYQFGVQSPRQSAPVDAVALRAFLDPPRPRLARPEGAPRGAGRTNPERLAGFVASTGEGRRNSVLFWAACEMVRDAYDPASVLGVLGPAAAHAGLGEREIEATVRSAFKRAVPITTRGGGGRPFASEGVHL